MARGRANRHNRWHVVQLADRIYFTRTHTSSTLFKTNNVHAYVRWWSGVRFPNSIFLHGSLVEHMYSFLHYYDHSHTECTQMLQHSTAGRYSSQVCAKQYALCRKKHKLRQHVLMNANPTGRCYKGKTFNNWGR